MITGAAYIRVSTGKQEELSPDSQRRLILEYATQHQIEIPDQFIFVENGISGRRADKRPQFQTMIALAKAKRFQVILLWKFSRFARNQEESIVYKSMLRKSGVEVISISEPLAEGPFGSLIERIIEWMDEFYSIRLSGDVTRGMTEKALRGGCQCRPPLGYRIPYHNGSLQVVEQEAAIIRTVYERFVYEGLSPYQIAKGLNKEGCRTKTGGLFERRSVEYILDNPCYGGFLRWNRTEHSSGKLKDPSCWIIQEGQHCPIISKELYLAAQEQRKEKKRCMAASQSNGSHWMSGLLKCSACGGSLSLSARKNRYGQTYGSFQCCRYAKGTCQISHSVSERKIAQAVLQALGQMFDPCHLLCYPPKSPQELGQNLLHDLEKQMEQLTQKKHRLQQAYSDGTDTLEEYRQAKTTLQKQKQALLAQHTALSARLHIDTTDKRPLEFHSVCDLFQSPLFSVEEKRQLLGSMVEAIIYDKKHHCITIRYHWDDPMGIL